MLHTFVVMLYVPPYIFNKFKLNLIIQEVVWKRFFDGDKQNPLGNFRIFLRANPSRRTYLRWHTCIFKINNFSIFFEQQLNIEDGTSCFFPEKITNISR